MRKILALLASAILVACASAPEKLQTQYVSELQYLNHDCDQLAMEESRISRRVSELYGTLDKKAGDDAAQMGIGLVLFWPALFFLEGGDGPEAQEYSRLKGEHEAIERVAIQRKCTLDIKPIGDQIRAFQEAKRAEEMAHQTPTDN